MENIRTTKQNNAIHLFCKKLAEELNAKGYDMKVVLKPTYKLMWETKTVKEHIFKPIIKALYNKDSTKDLTTNEVTKAHEQIMIALQDKLLELDYIDFPSQEQTENYLQSYDRTREKTSN